MNFLQDKIFLEKRSKQQHYFFSVVEDGLTLSWDKVIECLNFNTVNEIRCRLLYNYGMVIYDYNNIEIIKKILREYSLLDTSARCSVQLYISLTEVSEAFDRHNDNSDVLFWQSIGSTRWVIEEGTETFTYILKPNDFIYVPKNMYHTVIPLTPRVGVSFGLDYSPVHSSVG